MSTFYFHLQATADENVIEHEAADKATALDEVTERYTSTGTDREHLGIEVKMITKAQYDSDKKRIQTEREIEANATEE